MTTISLPESTPIIYSPSDPLQALQVNPEYNHLSFSNQNYSSMIQQLLYQIWKQKDPRKEKSPEPPPALPPTESTVIHLVRPKSIQHIDLDSILKSKKSQKTQAKKKNQKNVSISSTINRSHSSFSLGSLSSVFEPIRNICTPDWTTRTPETTLPNPEIDNSDIESFNIVPVHSRIEVFEYRIQMGEDENHLHPALARIAAESTEDDNFTKIEKDKGTRYEEQKVIQKVPLFWPSRVYDKEDNIMSEKESNQLEQIIQKEIDSVGEPREKQKKKIAKSHSIPLSSLIPAANKKKSSLLNEKTRKVGRPPKFSAVTTLYFGSFITDDDEDLTDFDF